MASCPVLITACPLRRVLVRVSSLCLGSGVVRFGSRRGLALVRGCLSTSSALGLSWVGSRPVFPTASVFVVALSTVRCDSRDSCRLTGSLLARCWLAAGSHVELYDSVQRNRVRRCWAVVGFTPSTRLLLPGSVWVDLGFGPPCLDHTRCLLEARPVPGSSRSVLLGHVPFSPSLSSLVRLSSWLVLPLHALPHPGHLDLSPSGSLGFC